MLSMAKVFTNYISLGYFCEVAQDLGKLGLRNFSSPFDWGISSFPHVIEAIDNGFDGFLDYDNLSQSTSFPNYYHDDRYHFWFYHDFSMFTPLDVQYEDVKRKYWRRINRFLDAIKSPTLFIRYISSEEYDEFGRSLEVAWIEKNLDYILGVLQRHNPENEIVFIGDETVNSDIIRIYHVDRDKGDTVSRLPIYSNKELYSWLSSIDFSGKAENQKRYVQTLRRTKYNKIKRKIDSLVLSKIKKPYTHDKTRTEMTP